MGALVAFSIPTSSLVGAQEATVEGDGAESVRDESARQHFESGRAYFAAGEYEQALEAFEEAYELSGRGALLYNIYLCHERLGQWAEAAEALEGYMSAEDVSAERANLESRLQHLRERAAQASTEPARPVGESVPAERTSALRIASLASFALAGAGATLWLVGGSMGMKEDRHLESTCSPNCTDSEVDRLRTLNTVANVGIAVGAVGLAAGITLLLLDRRRDDDSTHARLSPSLGPDGAGVSARGTF